MPFLYVFMFVKSDINNPMDYLFPCSLSYFYPIHGVACFHHSRSDEDTIREIMADASRRYQIIQAENRQSCILYGAH